MSDRQLLPLHKIRIDGGTQMRDAFNQEMINDIAIAVRNGETVPDAVVFFDGITYWLADGFHRFHGYKQAEKGSMPCEVRQGNQRDAILYAAGANSAHGQRRSAQDKRKSVEAMLNDEEWAGKSDNWIAQTCRVGPHLVADVRRLRAQTSSENGEQGEGQGEEETRTDTKGRKQPARKPKKQRKLCERCEKHGPARDCVYCEELNGAKPKKAKPSKNGQEVMQWQTVHDHLGYALRDLGVFAARFYELKRSGGLSAEPEFYGLERQIKEVMKTGKEWAGRKEKELKKKEKANG